MNKLAAISGALLTLAGVSAWFFGGLPALLGVVIGAIAALLPTIIPVFALKQNQPLVNPTMLAMTLRMLLAGAIVLAAVVLFEKPVVQAFAFGLVVAYVISLVAETVFFAKALAAGSGNGPTAIASSDVPAATA